MTRSQIAALVRFIDALFWFSLGASVGTWTMIVLFVVLP